MTHTTGEPFGVRPTQSTASSTTIPNAAPYPDADLVKRLRNMPEEAVVAYLRGRGWLVEWPGAVFFARVGSSSLPPGSPPLADEDALPFDGEDRRL